MPSLPEIGSSLPEVVLRTAIVYLFLVAVFRLSGKRRVGQAAIRSHGLAGVDDVRFAVLETDGSISVIPRDGGKPTSNQPPGEDHTA